MDIVVITIFVLAIFVGFEIITKVPPTLHTPLMSVTNAISGIIVVGALIAVGTQVASTVTPANGNSISISRALGFFAVLLASINIFGGFIVTQRMLQMFKRKK